MNNSRNKKLRPVYLLLVIGLAIIPIVLLMGAVPAAFGEIDSVTAVSGTPLSPGPGYLDFSYDDADRPKLKAPTGEKAESKLWWNDGYWWGSMYVAETNAYHIHRLQWGTQTWVDTGVQLDDTREPADPETTKADTLWDDVDQKLYVVSHAFTKNSSPADEKNYARLFRYSYDAYLQTYTLDAGFEGPKYVAVNEDKVEVLTMDKDSKGRLWTTYVSRPSSSGIDYQVYVNASAGGSLGDDDNWGTPFPLPAPAPVTATHVTTDDISTLVAFNNHIAVVWSNQSEAMSDTLHLALHSDSSGLTSGWQYYSATLPSEVHIDDHLSAKSIAVSNDQLFVALKLDNDTDSSPGIGMYSIDTNGNFSFHKYSEKQHRDTRPILIIDESADEIHLFVTGKAGGSKICYKTLSIPPAGDFAAGDCGIDFIEDDFYKNFNNATSMKRNANALTGIVVLAGDDDNGKYYAHNTMGDPPPVVDATGPARSAPEAPLTSTVTARFSKDMNAATLSTTSFTVRGPGGTVVGNVTYDSVSKVATFTPDQPLAANATYIVELTQAVQDTTGTSLNEGIESGSIRETWDFTTTGPPVHFSSLGYTVNEGEVATVLVTLQSTSIREVKVDYKTVDLTPGEVDPPANPAVAGVDYTHVTDTLTFAPGVTSQTFTVTTLPNTDLDGQKVLGLELSNAIDTTLGEPHKAKLTIFDDEAATVRFNNASYTVGEGDGQATIEVSLSVAAPEQVTVHFSTEDGTATAGEDYTAVTNQPIVFAAGETTVSVPVPTVSIIDDDLNEENETVNLILDNPSPANTVIANSPAVLIIIDNDPEPSMMFSSNEYTANESDGKVTLEVKLSTVSGRKVKVKYETAGGSATPGIDYEPATGTVTFEKGDLTQGIEVKILSDQAQDGGETFNVILSEPDGATLGVPFTAEVTITEYNVFLPVILAN